jgi:hypothetical protein
LVNKKIIDRANYSFGYCGGAEISYFVLLGTFVGSTIVNVNNFNNFIQKGLSKFYVERSKDDLSLIADITNTKISVSPFKPNYPTVRSSARVPSEVSRKTTETNMWDKFDVVFSLYRVEGKKVVIELHAKNLRRAPRVKNRNNPPSSEHFRGVNSENDYEAEYIIAAGIARYFVKEDNDCVVLTEGFYSKDQWPFRCAWDENEFRK